MLIRNEGNILTSGLEGILNRGQGKEASPKKKTKPVVPLNENDASSLELVRAIDNHLASKNVPKARKYEAFHPSSTNPCKRWGYLRFDGAEALPKYSPRLHRIFDNGHMVHERYRRYFEEMGILIQAEVPFFIDDPVAWTA
jgi:hypothetical protein